MFSKPNTSKTQEEPTPAELKRQKEHFIQKLVEIRRKENDREKETSLKMEDHEG